MGRTVRVTHPPRKYTSLASPGLGSLCPALQGPPLASDTLVPLPRDSGSSLQCSTFHPHCPQPNVPRDSDVQSRCLLSLWPPMPCTPPGAQGSSAHLSAPLQFLPAFETPHHLYLWSQTVCVPAHSNKMRKWREGLRFLSNGLLTAGAGSE